MRGRAGAMSSSRSAPRSPPQCRPDVAQLAGQRRRRARAGVAQQLDERRSPSGPIGGPSANVASSALDRVAIARARRRAARSSTSSRSGPTAGFSFAIRVRSSSSSRSAGGSGSGPGPGNSSPNRSSRRPRIRARAASRGPSSASAIAPGPAVRLVAGDEQVADLVEQPERADLAGLDRRRRRRSRAAFIRRGEPADGRPCRRRRGRRRSPISGPSTP